MDTSVGSIGSDSFLEPHQPSPPHILKVQFQHQYFRNMSSATDSPLQFADGYRYQYHNYYHHQHQSGNQPPSPDYRQSQHSQQSRQQGRTTPMGLQSPPRTFQRQESSSSIASSETASSSSTSSELNPSASSASLSCGPHAAAASKTPLKAPVDSVIVASLLPPFLLTRLDSQIMPPPPAYASKKCDSDVIIFGDGETVSEKGAMARLDVSLPEIASVGDLLSELEVDFETLQF
ncbi:hypothetical protein EDD21DRAFT_390280 [Dissophora ornata]|nr:hypothetical protein EDD21DRAFT_390280 [Dissophora ornata]